MLEAIVRSVGDEGRTVIFSSHLLDEIARVSDRVAMLANGRLVLSGELSEVLDSHRRVVIRMRMPVSPDALPGALSVSGGPEEWTVICNGELNALTAAVHAGDGEVMEETGASFEEVFHARVSESRLGEASRAVDPQ
jgi:ABC-2 type transport system ATP-binding protein